MRYVALLALMAAPLLAQEEKKEENKEEKAPVYVALKGGDVYTVTKGVLKNADVLIKDGRIERIGAGLKIPKEAEVHDVTGKRVLPGFVAITARGLGLGWSGRGDIADNIDPFSENLKLALASGITTAYVEYGGGGGFFGGRVNSSGDNNAVIKTTYGELEGIVIREPVAVNLNTWMEGTPSARFDIRENFRKAREFIENEKDYEKRKAEGRLKEKEQPPRASGTVMNYTLLLKGERIARMSAGQVPAIRTALTLINDYQFKAILDNIDEGWIVPDDIGRSHAYCVVTPRSRLEPDRNLNRPSGSSIEQAKILSKAGVRIAIISLSPSVGMGGIAGRDLLNLPLEAGFAIRGGLDEETALKAITIFPAEMLGVSHRVGSIEEGKDADLIVLDGDPFHYRTFVELTFVNGKLYYDKSKERYFSHIRNKK